MQLLQLKAEGFRSLKDIVVEFKPLTLLIGENDAGKSSVLDLLEIMLTKKQPDRLDFYCDLDGNVCERIEVIADFDLNDEDVDAVAFSIRGRLRIKKCYSLSTMDRTIEEETFCFSEQPVDEALRQDFSKMDATAQRELILDLDPDVDGANISNSTKRTNWLQTYVEDRAQKEEAWIPADRQLESLLPRFERYSAMDYQDPARLVAKTLAQTYEQTLYEEIEEADGTTRRQLIESLRQVQQAASQQMQSDINMLLTYIRKYDRRVANVGYKPEFDFRKSLQQGEFQVNKGRGLHALSRMGDGTKRRLFMGILDWDREVSLSQAAKLPPVIRGYDEPDANLHYAAQQLMYQSIYDIVREPDSNVQAVICTHSLTMINQCPAQNIRLLRLCDEGYTELAQIDTNDDPEIEQFLSTLARELGITNTLIFYERCFILIEGESEENALPIFYQTLYGRSLIEDGIHIINTRGNGAIQLFLKLMSRNRQEATIVFIDRDAENQTPARLTQKTLRQAGFSSDFIKERIVFIGTMEFEDAFDNHVLARCLQQHWPKKTGAWCETDVAALRDAEKFSDELGKAVAQNCGHNTPYFSKPVFGEKIARLCTEAEIPAEISRLFSLARRVSGAEIPMEEHSSV